MKRFVANLLIAFVFTVVLFSCAAPQKTIYFRTDAKADSVSYYKAAKNNHDGVIQPDDIVSINITSISSITEKDPASIFKDGGTNAPVVAGRPGSAAGGGGGGMNGVQTGYLVDKDGYVDFPVIGKIELAGQTMRQAKETIAAKLKDYVKEPVVEVRIINYKITILGEVQAPGTIVAPNHKISVVEAIAAAGDIPITGRKDNVLVIREIDGKREFARLNLNSKEVFNSPYFYLRQNDLVYVEPSRVRRQEGNIFMRVYLPAFTTLLSTALAVYGIVQITNNK